jgi:pimeloyl-ACP methyl ester carboxylesterase
VARVLIVPGLAVRRYVQPAADALGARGTDTRLLPAPGEPGTPAQLRAYGEQLARQLGLGDPVDMLIGLSVGAQAAAAAAAMVPPESVRRLVLISPTVDPQARGSAALVRRWIAGGRLERGRLGREQAPDWLRAGPRRIATVVRSAVALHLEDLLPDVAADLTVIHAERDVITSHSYAAALACAHGGRLLVVPGATHSWPYGDSERFADTVVQILQGRLG